MKTLIPVLLCLFTTFLSAQSYNEGTLAPRLQDRIDTQPETKHLVYALLTDHVDIDALEDSFDERRVTLHQRVYEVITTLQAKADETQPAFVADLRKLDGLNPETIRQFWVNNVVFFEANKAAISAISHRDDIYWMDLNVPNDIEEHESIASVVPPSPNGTEPGLEAINAPKLWQMGYTGYGGIAFGADTGIDNFHPSIEYKYLGYYQPDKETWVNFTPNGNVITFDTIPGNCGDHGTHTLGTMVGLDRNTNDTVGVAYGANWIGAAILCNGIGTADNIAAFEWALNPDGIIGTIDDIPDVINNSWWDSQVSGGTFECTSVYVNVVSALEAAGIANIFSAGNSGPGGSSITAPKNINTDTFNIFCVAALNGNNANYPVAGFSSRGPSICGGVGSLEIKPEVAAPGENVRSCEFDGSYGTKSGTSMAAPHVAGAVLLLREAFPTITGKDALRALYHSCTDLGDVGEDNDYGMGIINVLGAFNYLQATGLTPVSPHANNDALVVNLESGGLYCTETFNVQLTFENAGLDTLTSVSISTEIRSSLPLAPPIIFTTEWTGQLTTRERATVQLVSPALQSGEYRVISTLRNPNGVPDEKPLNNRAIETLQMEVLDPYTVSLVNFDSTLPCENSSALLYCDYAGEGDIEWYNVNTGGAVQGEGNYFLTPPLATEQTFYVQVTGSEFAGKESIDLDQSDVMDNDDRLIFDAYEAFVLKSVKVYAEVAGSRFFVFKNVVDNYTVDRLVSVEAGWQEVILDIDIPPGFNHEFGIFAGQPLLYSTEADFPYDLAGKGAITNSNGVNPLGKYYGFYDWEIQGANPCSRVPFDVVVVESDEIPEAVFSPSATSVDLGESGEVTFTDASVNATSWDWDLGDGSVSSDQNPVHIYTEVGTYLVSLSILGPDGCSDASVIFIEVTDDIVTGTSAADELKSQIHIYPNPSNGLFQIDFDLAHSHYIGVDIYDALGQKVKTVAQQYYYKDKIPVDMSSFPTGLYYVTLNSELGLTAFKVVKR